MRKILLVILLGLFCVSVNGSDEDAPETETLCDAESEETCEAEEELERGFDPCLINANLPACKSDEEGGDSAVTERSSSESENPDDSD